MTEKYKSTGKLTTKAAGFLGAIWIRFIYLFSNPCQMRRILFPVLLLLLISVTAQAQPERIGFGLAFGQKVRFNGGDTGNPGLNVKTWIALDRDRKLHIVPSVTAFNPGRTNRTTYWVNDYRFHADLDVQYAFLQEKTLKVAGLAGINYSYLTSTNEILGPTVGIPVDSTLYAFGPSLGAQLEMRMHSFWDFVVSARYTAASFSLDDGTDISFFGAPLSGVVIQVHAVYYFYGRGKGYRY